MLKRSHYITLGLAALLTLVILNLPSHTTTRLKQGIGSVFLPLVGLATASRSAATAAADTLTPRTVLARENETLRRANQELRFKLMQAEETARENERLRQLFNWQKTQPRKYKLANVVLRDPANWWRTVQIDLGTRHGVKPDLPVLTPEGLVGKISSVTLDRSQVVLIGDPNCRVSALVENETRDTGSISGAGPLDHSLVEMSYLSPNANLKSGQNVLTSGLGGVFPKGIPIGKVVDSHPAEYGLHVLARVKLAANLSALEEVWVLFP